MLCVGALALETELEREADEGSFGALYVECELVLAVVDAVLITFVIAFLSMLNKCLYKRNYIP